MDRKHRGDLDLEVKIHDLELECEMYKKNNQMYKDHISQLQNTIDRLTTMNKSHKTILQMLKKKQDSPNI